MFPETAKGLRLLHSAQVLEIFAILIGSVALTPALENAPWLILALAAVVMLIISFINSLKGLHLIAREDNDFRFAYELTICELILEFCCLLFTTLARWFPAFQAMSVSSQLQFVFALIADIAIISGIQNVFRRCGQQTNARYAFRLNVLVIISGIVMITMIVLSKMVDISKLPFETSAILFALCFFCFLSELLYIRLLRVSANKLDEK